MTGETFQIEVRMRPGDFRPWSIVHLEVTTVLDSARRSLVQNVEEHKSAPGPASREIEGRIRMRIPGMTATDIAGIKVLGSQEVARWNL